MIIWHADTKEKLAVSSTGGVSFLLWNPTVSKLLSATRSKVFRYVLLVSVNTTFYAMCSSDPGYWVLIDPDKDFEKFE